MNEALSSRFKLLLVLISFLTTSCLVLILLFFVVSIFLSDITSLDTLLVTDFLLSLTTLLSYDVVSYDASQRLILSLPLTDKSVSFPTSLAEIAPILTVKSNTNVKTKNRALFLVIIKNHYSLIIYFFKYFHSIQQNLKFNQMKTLIKLLK